MSKSDTNENAVVRILDPRDVIIKKFKRAVTDSDNCISYNNGSDGVRNLMTIYSCFTHKSYDEIEREFDGRGYGDFKTAVGEACADGLADVQKKYGELMADKSYLESVMRAGAEKASHTASKTVAKVARKLGFVQI